jgi:NAD(P)-dependent dehydrogenase (short-subunit alcohol dehydrogenase family)
MTNNNEGTTKKIDADSVFLVSGGGRGITAQAAIALARQYKCQFILLGRSSIAQPEASWTQDCQSELELKKRILKHRQQQGEKPAPASIQQEYKLIAAKREIKRTLQEIEQVGGKAEYLSVDVTDKISLEAELATVTQRLGSIKAIVHGAGNLADKLIEQKSEADYEIVYAPKVKGLENLLNCVNPSQLDHLVLFSSVVGFYGNAGQTDYAIAFSSEGVQACQEAFERAQIEPQAISYLDICSSPIASIDDSEIRGAIAAYQTSEATLNCALGKVTNIGVVSEIASIIKTALCLYFRYIPAFPEWSTPEDLELWQISPFYIASQSKPWFLEVGATERVAAINSTNQDGTYVHSILVEDSERQEYYNSDLEQKFFYLLPLAASDRTSLEQQLYTLQKSITDTDSLPSIAKETLINYHQSEDLPYAIVILGKNKRDLLREIDRAWKGVAQAFETGQDWQTPLGSCFTVNPQGKKGKVAYVYPGAYNAHLGLGRNLFRLFPQLFDDLLVQSTRNRLAKLEKLLYPRSLTKLSRKQLVVHQLCFEE